MRKGNKQNAFLNGEWCKHVRHYLKKRTSRLRRIKQKSLIKEDLKNTAVSPHAYIM